MGVAVGTIVGVLVGADEMYHCNLKTLGGNVGAFEGLVVGVT